MAKLSGYSLIELVIVVGLLAILGISSTYLFHTTLSGGGKATALAKVKEYGDEAMITFERRARNAVEVEQCNVLPDLDILEIENVDGSTTTFEFTDDGRLLVHEDGETGALVGGEVRVTEGAFNCALSDTNPDIVEMVMTLQLGNEETDRPVDIYSQQFHSKITLRNY